MSALIIYVVLARSNTTNKKTDHVAVIKEIRNLQRLETASFTIEKIIDTGTSGGAIKEFLFGDKLLLIAHGQVIAGFDLSQISDKDVVIRNNTISITLPKPQILVATLDNSQTRVYDRSKGILNPGDSNLESKAREEAQNSIRESACAGGILTQASDSARKQISTLLSAFGFTTVTINIPETTCK